VLFFHGEHFCYVVIPMNFYTPEKDLRHIQNSSHLYEQGDILLLGDSISIGYTPVVQKLYEGRKKVCRPSANCGDTKNGVEHIHEWLGNRRWKVIHFNWGLHDLCYRHPDSQVYGNRDKINGTLSVPLDQYVKNLKRIIEAMLVYSDRLIWATTTVIPEGEAGRFPGDEVLYNGAARRVVDEYGIAVNDLYALTRRMPVSCFITPGDVHFTEPAYSVIGQQVYHAIGKVLEES